MTSAAISAPGKPTSRWIWGWACYLLLSAGVAGLMLVGRLLNYFEGLSLGKSDVLISMAITLMLVLSLLLLSVFGLFALYRIIRGRDHWLKLGILALPGMAVVGVPFIPLPSFNDGVKEILHANTSGAEFVTLAKATVAKPPGWIKDEADPAFSPEKEKWLQTAVPFDRLEEESSPRIRLKGRTLQVEWGGPLSRRWGLAISSTAGVKPEIPSHAGHSEQVHPEVWLFNIYL